MIKIALSCACTDGEVEFWVMARKPDEDIRDWMDSMQAQVTRWHSQRECTATHLNYIKIPTHEDKPLGAV